MGRSSARVKAENDKKASTANIKVILLILLF